jgi:molybdopterin molybdotransferase
MLTADEAARRIVGTLEPLPDELVPLHEALDRVLAEHVQSPIALPHWENSAMDGYAVRATDVAEASADHRMHLEIIESVPAGGFPSRSVGPGQAVRIFTGAPVPKGGDSVVRQEDTEPQGDTRVAVLNARDAGRNIRRRGEDLRQDDLVAAPGTELGPAQLGVLASIAHGTVRVHRRPRVALLASGDEVVDLDRADDVLAGRKIASSNTYTLRANVLRAGGEPLELGIAADTPESLRSHLAHAREADLLVTTGGVSVGAHDFVRQVLEELGCEMDFWRVRMRPGAPLGFGRLGMTPWLGLPGNPVSAMVTFELFVRPALRRLAGHPFPFRRATPVEVTEPIRLSTPLRHFLRAVVSDEGDGRLQARLTGAQGSGILTSMVRANALLVVPEDRPTVEVGETLSALVLDDPVHVPEPSF